MSRKEEILQYIKSQLSNEDTEIYLDVDDYKVIVKALEQEPCTLDYARENFVSDVYNILDFLPTNNEANQIIDVFDRVTSGVEQEPILDKIIAEIDGLTYYWCEVNPRSVIEDVLKIIDKYKEGEEN